MKKIMIFLIALNLAACSPVNKEEGSLDTTAAVDCDTTAIEPLEDPTITSPVVVSGDTSLLIGRLDEISEANASA
jgi:hypothetical protein